MTDFDRYANLIGMSGESENITVISPKTSKFEKHI